jgi:hypothetical protein
MCTMAYDDDGYVLDADGTRVLIGLTLRETREYLLLDELISDLSSGPADDNRSLKHEAAVRTYLSTQNAKALRGD